MKLPAILLSLVCGALARTPAHAGGEETAPVVRKQFRQATAYPYIFQPDCYLATTGPAPLRFAAPGRQLHAPVAAAADG